MKKTYALQNLDCAHCAAKMEAAIGKLKGVQSVSIAFLTQRLTLEAEEADLPDLLPQVERICRKIEPDCRLVIR